jgi:hypothetical protein
MLDISEYADYQKIIIIIIASDSRFSLKSFGSSILHAFCSLIGSICPFYAYGIGI